MSTHIIRLAEQWVRALADPESISGFTRQTNNETAPALQIAKTDWRVEKRPSGPLEVRKLVYFKACKRCGGDMHENRDIYGSYRECLACGNMKDLDDPLSVMKSVRRKTRATKKAAA